MSYFAELNDKNEVIRVLVGDDNLPNKGYNWFVENLGGKWVRTSYDGDSKNFAFLGYFYDQKLNAFIAPQPFASWVLDEETCRWEAPIAYPEGELLYTWNEELLDWEPTILDVNTQELES